MKRKNEKLIIIIWKQNITKCATQTLTSVCDDENSEKLKVEKW